MLTEDIKKYRKDYYLKNRDYLLNYSKYYYSYIKYCYGEIEESELRLRPIKIKTNREKKEKEVKVMKIYKGEFILEF